MEKGKIRDAARHRILVSDGAWGTAMQDLGLQPGECPEYWSLQDPDKVYDIATSYLAAGADMVQSNSFGGNRYKLEMYGLDGQTREINRQAAAISRKAAGDNHWVIASAGPSGKMLLLDEISESDLFSSFAEQAGALAAGGADAICLETMSAIDEAVIAIRAAREHTKLEIICTFTFDATATDREYRTMMGISPVEAAEAALEAGAHIIGSNCGNGFAGMTEIVRQMKSAAGPGTPILVHANAGLPRMIDGKEVFPETPEKMAAQVPALIEAGAKIIGGCCGTTAAHIKAIKQAIAKYTGEN